MKLLSVGLRNGAFRGKENVGLQFNDFMFTGIQSFASQSEKPQERQSAKDRISSAKEAMAALCCVQILSLV